jgi:hypothetical protein
MDTINDLERKAWDQIAEATQRRDPKAIAYYGAIAQEIAEKKQDWAVRMEAASVNGTSTVPSSTKGAVALVQNYTSRPVRAFILHGKRYAVNTYRQLLVDLANLLRQKHSPERFDEVVLEFGGRKRQYFSKESKTLKYAQELEGGGIFVETNLNANLIVNNICFPMVRRLEGPGNFQVEL